MKIVKMTICLKLGIVRKKKQVIFGSKFSELADKFKYAKSYVNLCIERCDSNICGDDTMNYIKKNIYVRNCFLIKTMDQIGEEQKL